MKSSHLKKICEGVQCEGIHVQECAAERDVPFPHLKIAIASAIEEGKSYTLIGSIQSHKDLAKLFEAGEKCDLAQLLYLFPYQVRSDQIGQTGRLLALINKIAPFAGFGLDENSMQCYFRYAFPLALQEPSYRTFAIALELIKDTLNIYAPTIDDVCTGAVSLEELLQTFEDAFTRNVGETGRHF